MSETNSSTTTPTPDDVSRKQTTDVYHTALVRAFLFQVLFAVLASLILDGGIFRRFFWWRVSPLLVGCTRHLDATAGSVGVQLSSLRSPDRVRALLAGRHVVARRHAAQPGHALIS